MECGKREIGEVVVNAVNDDSDSESEIRMGKGSWLGKKKGKGIDLKNALGVTTTTTHHTSTTTCHLHFMGHLRLMGLQDSGIKPKVLLSVFWPNNCVQ